MIQAAMKRDEQEGETCWTCGLGEMQRYHHEGNFAAPECTWLECDNCDRRTPPE